MIKVFKSLFLIIIFILISCYPVHAEVKTFERTDSSLGIWEHIEVTDSNRQLILNTPKVDEKEKVYDFAVLFSEEEINDLYNKIQTYIEKFNMDMVIVSINNNNKGTAQEYADDFYDYNYFGTNSSKDGILFLIDMDTRQIYISTTGKAIDKYNDNKIDSILDSSYKYMTEKNYYKAAEVFIDKASSNNIPWALIIILPFLTATIPVIIFVCKNKMVKKATEANRYIDKDNIKIIKSNEAFITTNTIRTKIETPSTTSSTHTGSSGTSHGGGGRSF